MLSIFHNMTQIILDLNKSVFLCTADRERDHLEQCYGALAAMSGCYVTVLVPLVSDVIA